MQRVSSGNDRECRRGRHFLAASKLATSDQPISNALINRANHASHNYISFEADRDWMPSQNIRQASLSAAVDHCLRRVRQARARQEAKDYKKQHHIVSFTDAIMHQRNRALKEVETFTEEVRAKHRAVGHGTGGPVTAWTAGSTDAAEQLRRDTVHELIAGSNAIMHDFKTVFPDCHTEPAGDSDSEVRTATRAFVLATLARSQYELRDDVLSRAGWIGDALRP